MTRVVSSSWGENFHLLIAKPLSISPVSLESLRVQNSSSGHDIQRCGLEICACLWSVLPSENHMHTASWLTYSTISVSRRLLAVHLRLPEAREYYHRTAPSRLSSPSLKRRMKSWWRIVPEKYKDNILVTLPRLNQLVSKNIPGWRHMKWML